MAIRAVLHSFPYPVFYVMQKANDSILNLSLEKSTNSQRLYEKAKIKEKKTETAVLEAFYLLV